MEREIYLFGINQSKSKFEVDADAMRSVDMMHQARKVDAIFVPQNYFRLLERYCRENQTSPISLQKTEAFTPIDQLLSVINYSKAHPQEARFVQVADEGNLEELLKLFKKANFIADRVEV